MASPREVPVEVRAARLAVISRLADDLAHEIKNPLNAVVINLAVLRTRVARGDHEGALERAEVVEAEVLRAHDLIDRVLRLARPAADDPLEESVDGVLAEVVPLAALQARLASVAFEAPAAPAGLRLLACPASLRAALLALLGDAVEAAAPGDAQEEADGGGEPPTVVFRCAAHEDGVRFLVGSTEGAGAANGSAEVPGGSAAAAPATSGSAPLPDGPAAVLAAAAGGRLEHTEPGPRAGFTWILELPGPGA